ncbi:chemotaxis-specific protein-glutamate methyltransferase CheB [Pseudobdellovibrio exovorus]|uniref:Protein-glutamate methylesterase/protein-glutamine glutaminase n=1 Tax=Pseudobdellovibrio exovorus JSS TaxID=1184267 RepID=M4V5T4_9BACT|nr:chemotaxis-specific protein-glutamate methyltransferase CheB [Pseudobdellovibrio exovorus]AGH94528.1 hypothetical protein A11Q_308 [Pseudobdellovibrio exovorus JSS]
MSKVKVLIADDSVVYRSQIRASLEDSSWIEVVGTASNGRQAIERLTGSAIDLLILDLEMPVLDGLETLREMQKLSLKTKVILFSSSSKRGAEITLEALRLGASDFISKPSSDASNTNEPFQNPAEKIKKLLLPKVSVLFPHVAPAVTTSSAPMTTSKTETSFVKVLWEAMRPQVILIGSSTGGPTVLEKIFSDLGSSVDCPILIAQHMPPIFTASFAERLSRCSGIPASEAKHGMVLEKNHIYVAAGNYHMRVQGTRDHATLVLDQGPQIHSVRPAVDPLFVSAASVFKDKCLAFVLTGMGEDGKDGAVAVKKSSGAVVIQNESTCVVYGMPKAVFSSGAYDKIATPQEITSIIRDKVGVSRTSAAASGDK